MEGDAGTRQLNPTGGQERSDPGKDSDADAAPDDAAAKPEESLAVSTEEQIEQADAEEPPEPVEGPVDDRRPSRLGVGWAAGICVVLVLLAAGAGVGGYLALRTNDQSKAIARAEVAALQAAKDCVAATQAPDTAAMVAAQSKIIQCSTGDFGVQAPLYASVIAEAYQAANVKVAVSDIRAAVERHNDDGSIDVLVAVRTKVTNSEAADQEQGYRLRVQMAPDGGTYKVARLDQVTS
jgi:Mce-associated membrane protein